MNVFVTKWALSHGIIKMQVTDCGNGMVKGPGPWDFFHGEGRDWHRTREAACDAAVAMRVKKIVSLQKQIEKLGKLEFT
jgi:hypothetical protein